MHTQENIEFVTNQSVILDYLREISSNNIPIEIYSTEPEATWIYKSSIQNIETKNKQIVLRQVLPSNWQEFIPPTTRIEISCRMPLGTIKFRSLLSPLDDSENSLYCRLTLPKKMSRKQLRANFRISLDRFSSRVSFKLGEETEVMGKCLDMSMGGALLQLSKNDYDIQNGQVIDPFNLLIADTLDLSSAFKVCNIEQNDRGLLLGVQFLDLKPSQTKPINAALNKIERQNITT